jgi:CheY-like chemotaxis protein
MLDLPLVLIVDDNDRNRKLAGDVLRLARFRTLEAGTAAEGIALIVLGGLLYAALDSVDSENPLVFLAVPWMIAGVLLHFRGRQQAAKAVAAGFSGPLHDSRPDVLYLRSFEADPATPFKKLFSGFTTEEEQLADVLRPFGDMIAIGRSPSFVSLPFTLTRLGHNDLKKALNAALRPVFERHGIDWRPRRRFG